MLRAALAAAALLTALGVAGVAQAEVEQEGDLIVAFDGGIKPRALPRTGMAPVAVSVESTFRAAGGSGALPQLRTIAIGINRAGKIFDRGLPTCRVRSIQPTTIRAARQICGPAIVGSGNVKVEVDFENQEPFTFEGPLLVFNATRSGGHRRLLGQVYGRKPPSAFVLNFRIVKKGGEFGTVIQTSLPKAARKWAYVTHFEMKLRRVYNWRGKRRSFISAGCAAPPGFPGAVYPFARSNFGFAGGQHVRTTLVRDCKVR